MSRPALIGSVCTSFKPHAFLNIDRCRDCGQPAADHVPSSTTRQSSLAAAHQNNEFGSHTFNEDEYDEDGLKKNCNVYTPHQWIVDRCRDCGRSEKLHDSSVGSDPAALLPTPKQTLTTNKLAMLDKAATAASPPPTLNTDTHTPSHINFRPVEQSTPINTVTKPIPAPTPLAADPPASSSALSAAANGVSDSVSTAEGATASDTSSPKNAAPMENIADAEQVVKTAMEGMKQLQKEFATITSVEAKRLQNKQETQAEHDQHMDAINQGFMSKQNEFMGMLAEAQRRIVELTLEKEHKDRQLAELHASQDQRIKAAADAAKSEAEERARIQTADAAAAAAKEASERTRAEAVAEMERREAAKEREIKVMSDRAAAATAEVKKQMEANLLELPRSNEETMLLAQVVERGEKLLQQGRNFIRFLTLRKKPLYISIFIRMLEKDQYSVYWCRADDRTASETRSIPFSELQKIVLGKQATCFRNPAAQQSPENTCFSIVGRNRSVHCQAGSEKDRDLFCYTLAHVLKLYGFRPALFTPASPKYVDGSDQFKKERECEGQELDDGANEPSVTDAQAMSNSMSRFYRLEVAVSCRGMPSLHSQQQQQNHIVCLVDRDEKTDRPVYVDQTEKVTQSSAPVFKKRFVLKFEDNPATGSYKKLRLNVYDISPGASAIEDGDRIGSAIVDVRRISESVGNEVEYTLMHKDAVKQSLLERNKSVVVVGCISKNDMPDEPLLSWPPEPIRAHQAMLTDGDSFTLFSKTSSSGGQPITLFYRTGATPTTRVEGGKTVPDLGTLFWVTAGEPLTEVSTQSMLVRSIVDLFYGKKSDVFPATSKEELCLSFVNKEGKRLDLEARTAKQRDQWMQAVISILKAAKSFQQLASASALQILTAKYK